MKMTDGWKKFLWGVAAGAVAAAFVQTDTFKKGAAKALACGAQLKEDAKEYFETLKEGPRAPRRKPDPKHKPKIHYEILD